MDEFQVLFIIPVTIKTDYNDWLFMYQPSRRTINCLAPCRCHRIELQLLFVICCHRENVSLRLSGSVFMLIRDMPQLVANASVQNTAQTLSTQC